jgi:hypothetical protein
MRRIAAPGGRRPRAALLLLFATMAVACGGERPAGTQRSQSQRSVSSTRGGDISLSGVVTATFGTYVFAVGSGVEQVIVVTRAPTDAVVGGDADVTGRLRTFRREELELELGVDLGGETDVLENRSCLVATVAHVTDRDGVPGASVQRWQRVTNRR